MKKLKLTKVIASTLVVASVFAFNQIGVSASWRQDNTGWWYTEGNSYATGWKLIEGNWYYFYYDGYMAKDTTIDGYYLNSNGAWTNSKPMREKIKGTWKSNFMNGANVPLTITDNMIGKSTYQIVEEREDGVVIDVNETYGVTRYLIKVYQDNIMMYIHNDNTGGYTAIGEGTRIS